MEVTAFIAPLRAWENVNDIRGGEYNGGRRETTNDNGQIGLFQDVFKSVVNQVKETQADVETKQYLLSTGQLDDAHTLPIAEAKASFSLDVLITLRNKTLESYNELIKINV
ncbi:MAG: flagellar hook-basal body complex protein FliE [Lachnospiraceae bacterium]|nr:flagellar hook-basal body complex protein FliE [Lachnospiraceae bacterium]